MSNKSIGVALIAISFIGLVRSEEPRSTVQLNLPDLLELEIKRALEVKKGAMKYLEMRSTGKNGSSRDIGYLGVEFESLIDRIAEIQMDENLIDISRKTQCDDIRAKMIVWALDRKSNKKEYERFARFYLNRPASEAVEYFSRIPMKELQPDSFHAEMLEKHGPRYFLPRPGTWKPNPVDAEDRIEDHRLVLEYCIFAPPTGRAFDRDLGRNYLSDALLGLGDHEKSFIVWKVDLEAALEHPLEANPHRKEEDRNVLLATGAFVIMGTEKAFRELAGYWNNERARKAIEKSIEWGFWPRKPMELSPADYGKAKKLYDTWMDLARKDREKDTEKSFAEWLLKQPAPEPPPPPAPVDPDDPFGGPR